MLTVTEFWGNDSFRIGEAHPQLKSIPNKNFRQVYPEGAALVEKDLASGKLDEAGDYIFIHGENYIILGYERVREKA